MVAPPELDRLSVADAVRRYLRQVNRAAAAGSLSQHTLKAYKRDLAEFVEIVGGDTVLDDLSAEDLDDAFVEFGSRPDGRFTTGVKKPGTPGDPVVGRGAGAVARFRQSVSRMFVVAERRGWVAMNPMPDTTVRPRVRGLASAARLAPSEETARALLTLPGADGRTGKQAARLAERDKAILTVLFEVGLRVSELCALNRTDLTDRDGTPWLHVRHGKGNKSRHVPISPGTAALLRTWMTRPAPTPPPGTPDAVKQDAAAAMFTTHRGKRLQPRSVQHLFTRLAAGLPGDLRRHITPHAARHSAATLLLASGAADVRTVQAILGHADLSTTGIYLDVADGRIAAAVAAHPLTGEPTG